MSAGLLWDFYLYYFRHWQTLNGNKEDRTLGKERVCQVEEEAWYGKRRNECKCERAVSYTHLTLPTNREV